MHPLRFALASLAMLAACPAAAQLRAVPDQPASAAAARRGVDVYLLNEGDAPVDGKAPPTIEVTAADAARVTLVPAEQAPASIAPHGFARVRYISAGVLAVGAPPPMLPIWPNPPTPGMTTATVEPAASTETPTLSANGHAAGFLDRFAPYEPVYGVAGGGDSGAKLQVSFALRPFGTEGALSHLVFAYTQTMFWAIDRPSGPFRTTTYTPELFVDAPIGHGLSLAAGYRHDSNGKAGAVSIDVNRLTLRVAKIFDLGRGWHAEVVPAGWVYIGERETPFELKRSWGYTSLKAAIGKDDGLKLSVTGRGSFETGRASAELYASYPLQRFGGLGIYLFGEAWTGYGEALDDYFVRDDHARIGIALTR